MKQEAKRTRRIPIMWVSHREEDCSHALNGSAGNQSSNKDVHDVAQQYDCDKVVGAETKSRRGSCSEPPGACSFGCIRAKAKSARTLTPPRRPASPPHPMP